MFKSCRPDSTNKKPFGESVEGFLFQECGSGAGNEWCSFNSRSPQLKLGSNFARLQAFCFAQSIPCRATEFLHHPFECSRYYPLCLLQSRSR
jgi:hypothetical protein